MFIKLKLLTEQAVCIHALWKVIFRAGEKKSQVTRRRCGVNNMMQTRLLICTNYLYSIYVQRRQCGWWLPLVKHAKILFVKLNHKHMGWGLMCGAVYLPSTLLLCIRSVDNAQVCVCVFPCIRRMTWLKLSTNSNVPYILSWKGGEIYRCIF